MINEIQRLIAKVTEGKNLSRDEATRAFQIVMNGGATPAQIASLLTSLSIKGETVEEITGAALALRAKTPSLGFASDAIDVCGTGGDGKNTLNVSTAVAIVVAACGVKVAKHGGKAVSSASGSADVLAALGVNIQADAARMQAALVEANLCFFFAPLYHRAMRHVAPVRQELGFRTIFNLLGPLVNPAQPRRQLMGVYDRALLEPIARVLKELGSERALVVHGSDGMDEITLSGATYAAELKEGEIKFLEIRPEEAGLELSSESLKGGDAQTNARELDRLLVGKKSAYRNTVLLNVAAALMVAEKAKTLAEGAGLAAQAIDDGHARETLATLVRITSAK